MRKATREITDLVQIADLLGRCDTIRIGITDDRCAVCGAGFVWI